MTSGKPTSGKRSYPLFGICFVSDAEATHNHLRGKTGSAQSALHQLLYITQEQPWGRRSTPHSFSSTPGNETRYSMEMRGIEPRSVKNANQHLRACLVYPHQPSCYNQSWFSFTQSLVSSCVTYSLVDGAETSSTRDILRYGVDLGR